MLNKQTGQTEFVVKQHRGELHPQIAIYAEKTFENLLEPMPFHRVPLFGVHEGERVKAGKQLARIPRGAIKTKDITGVFHVLQSFLKHENQKILLKLQKSMVLLILEEFRRISALLLCVMKLLVWKKSISFAIQST